jgi:signal transduction histidine kinase
LILILLIITIILYHSTRKSKKNLIEVNQKLVALNNERNKFFSIISHDLKSPFLGILGIAELLKEEFSISENKRLIQLINKLHEAVDNQYKLVDNLLKWTVMQSGKMTFEPTTFVLNDVIENVIASMKNFSFQKKISINYNTENDFKVFADKKMVSSILMNLISNAIKYSYQDSIVTIDLSQKDDKFVSVQIIDSGVGMSEKKLKELFDVESNASLEGTLKEKGTGLGLLIVKEMVTKNNGEIIVQSTENIGSTFEFTLPIAHDSSL